MDYEDVFYTYDGRNADRISARDHRRFVGRPAPVAVAAAPAAAPIAAAPMVAAPVGAAMVPQYNYATFPNAWGTSMLGYPLNPPYVMPTQTNLSSILGGFGDIGTLASIAAQIFAALMPLPNPPTPQDATDGNTQSTSHNAMINSANLIRYQSALADFARRDQQILTIGSVLKELLKRPGGIPALVGA
jgi:hypothetical protein